MKFICRRFKWTNASHTREIPIRIARPDYYITGIPGDSPNEIVISTEPSDLSRIRAAARLARQMLDFANSLARPGITTDEIDKLTHLEIIKQGAYPSPINYCGFPKAICTSVNEAVCHGIHDSRELRNGDLLSIDVSVFLDGYHGDNCGTVIVGNGDESAKKLVLIAEEALRRAISVCKPGS